MLINNKELKHCTDAELFNAWADILATPHDMAVAIIVEIDLRRAMRASSPFQQPRVPEIN